MANLTAKEKAVKVIVSQIKELDKNALTLDVLNVSSLITKVRLALFRIIRENGYELTQDYKFVLKLKK